MIGCELYFRRPHWFYKPPSASDSRAVVVAVSLVQSSRRVLWSRNVPDKIHDLDISPQLGGAFLHGHHRLLSWSKQNLPRFLDESLGVARIAQLLILPQPPFCH